MKTGRNEPCPCGSGKKYKRCCMDSVAKQHAALVDDISQTIAMNPTLTIDELNLVAQQKAAETNNRPNKDFCGLTPTQMFNWLYAPFNELDDLKINVPSALGASPVMRYLALILNEIIAQGGSMKATAKGNLPAKLVKQASELLPEFAVAQYEPKPSIGEFAGSNEDKFNALHYARLLAELCEVINLKGGRFSIKKATQEQYQAQGIAAFFLPMLKTAVKEYNWGYMDNYQEDVDIQTFWLFMLWRMQAHRSVEKLTQEVGIAFPDLLKPFANNEYFSQQDHLGMVIRTRFMERFLQFWGFITLDPRQYQNGKPVFHQATILPLYTQTFAFLV